MREFSPFLRSRLTEFAWSQWVQMGLSGHVTRRDLWAADPEALVLFGLKIGRYDPRLFDELLDWMRLNLHILSIQRLRNLAKGGPGDEDLVAAAAAWSAAHTRRVTRRFPPPKPRGEAEPLFVELPSIDRDRDSIFEEHGFLRSPAEPSLKSSEPDRRAPINLAFRLRDLFGVGVRAEVIRVLMLRRGERLRAGEVIDSVRYGRQNVHEALNSLVSAGVISVARRMEGHYTTDFDRWAQLFEFHPLEPPHYKDWPRLLGLLSELLAWSEWEAGRDLSDYMKGSEALQFVREHERDLLAAGASLKEIHSVDPDEYWSTFRVTVADPLLQQLYPRPDDLQHRLIP